MTPQSKTPQTPPSKSPQAETPQAETAPVSRNERVRKQREVDAKIKNDRVLRLIDHAMCNPDVAIGVSINTDAGWQTIEVHGGHRAAVLETLGKSQGKTTGGTPGPRKTKTSPPEGGDRDSPAKAGDKPKTTQRTGSAITGGGR